MVFRSGKTNLFFQSNITVSTVLDIHHVWSADKFVMHFIKNHFDGPFVRRRLSVCKWRREENMHRSTQNGHNKALERNIFFATTRENGHKKFLIVKPTELKIIWRLLDLEENEYRTMRIR